MSNWLNIIGEWTWLPSGFRYSWVLLFEAIPILLLFWLWHRRRRAVPLPVDHSLHGRGWLIKSSVNLAESLTPVVLGIVIFLLAGPLQLGKPRSQRALTNILFCVDVSGSMNAQFGEGTRYDASMKAINSFIDMRSGDAFGLQFFGNSVVRWTPLTTDPSALKCALPFMRPSVVPIWMGGTAIGTALLDARQMLMEQESGDRLVILVSDGASPDLNGDNDLEIARALYDAGITVYAIHIAEGDAPDPIVRLTSKTGGDVFVPGDEAALAGIFAKIDAMQKTETIRTIAEQQDNFSPYAFLGLAFFTFALACSFGLRYTPW